MVGQLGSVYKQPETGEDGPDTAGGCQVSRRGHNGGAKGDWQRGAKQGECAMYICECIVCATE
jgi:hypothetical protein